MIAKRFIYSVIILLLGLVEVYSQGNVLHEAPEQGTVRSDDLGFEMVYVPAGTVEMGIDRESFLELLEQGSFLQVPETQFSLIVSEFESQGVFTSITVDLPAFWIDRYEATIQQYHSLFEVCIQSGNCSPIKTDYDAQLTSDVQQPQVGVTWFDALRFCNTRQARLPTEYEWEYAARGPNNYIFPWGNILAPENIASANTTSITYPVGSKPSNVSWIGAFDLVGNAGEWVENRFVPYDMDIASWETLSHQPNFDTDRVVRGGSFATTSLFATSIARASADPRSGGDMGVRCVRSSEPS